MKRTILFNLTENGYGCFEDEALIFEIPKNNLEFNVKTFYEAFYGEGKDIDDIVVQNNASEDKNASRAFACVSQLIEKIKEKMTELPEQTADAINEPLLEKEQ